MKSKEFVISKRDKLDKILVKLCELVINKQKSNPNTYGMVAACVLDNDNNCVARTSKRRNGKWSHAEREAMMAYKNKYGPAKGGSIIITTLTPCSDIMNDRYGSSCTNLINNSDIKKVYCGYRDPSQENEHNNFTEEVTDNSKIHELCKQFADTFLKDKTNEDISRRGFLGGLLGTAAGLGATNAMAGKKKSNIHDKNVQAMNTKIDSKYQLARGEELPALSNNPKVEIAVQKAAKAHGITNPAELAQFMAQTNHESWDFTKLYQVGDKRVYGGKGLIQLTGKQNYAAASKDLGIDLVNHPEQAARLDNAIKIAIWFWKNEVRRYAKTPEQFMNTKLITRIVNGPDMNGLRDRHEKFKQYLNIL